MEIPVTWGVLAGKCEFSPYARGIFTRFCLDRVLFWHGEHVLIVILLRGNDMKNAFHGKSKLLVSAVAALFATVAYTAFADDTVKPGGNTAATQGRAIDDVKAGGKTTDAQGRALDENGKIKAGKKTHKAQGREIDDVKAAGKTTDTQGRALDEVKSGGKTTDSQGREVQKK